MKKHGIEIATTDVLGNKIEPKLLVGDFNGYGSGEIFDANAVHLLVLQQIADLVNLAPEALDTLGEIADVLNLKEDAIADLEEIRSGAALGATSYQKPLSGIPYSDMAEAVLLLLDKAGTALQSHQDISHKVDRNELEEVAFTGSYQSLSNKPFIPTLVSQLANDAGYLTLHQDISMKADRSELFSREYDDLLNKPVIPVVPENVGDFVNNVGYLTQHQDISGKQDVIADLETIRAGAALGATSIQQHLSLANYYTKGEVDTILTTIEGEIPTKLSLLQNDPGYLTAHLSLADYLRIADLPLNLSSYTNDVPFLTQHLDISGKADKSTTVTNVAYDTTNKKFTKTINGSTTDIVNASTVVSGGITVVNNTPTLDWNTTSTIGSVQGTELKVKLPANPNTDTNTAALKVSDTTNKKINTVESPNSYILFEGGTNEFTVKDGVNSFKVSVTPSITNNVTGSSLTANNIILGDGNSTVKDSGKAIESGSNTTLSANDAKIPTSLVVKNYIDTSLTSVLRYKGTIGSSGATVTALPATHYVGWVYVVATAGTYAGKACEVGDYVICRIDGTTANDAHWDVVNGENLVSSANNTAAWGSAVIVGNVDGTDLKFTMPANPNTWRGIQDNLTSSTNTTESLSAKQGYLLANGSARDDTKLSLSGGTLTGELISQNGGIWVQGGSSAGGNVGRMGLVSGMPTGLAYNTSKRGVRIYSNAIAFADPYNGNTNTDAGWVRHIEETANSGILEIAVGDDGSEEIRFRRYNTSSNIVSDVLVPNTTGTLALTSQIPTKASWNYDDVYLKLVGGDLTGVLTITKNTTYPLVLSGMEKYCVIDFKDNSGTAKADIGWLNDNRGNNVYMANLTSDGVISVNNSGCYYSNVLNNFNVYTIWHSGNDGSGSGLDADTVDGYHASSFLKKVNFRSDQNSIYDLRWNFGGFDKGDFGGTYASEYPYNYGVFISLTERSDNTGALLFVECDTSNALGHISVCTRGAGDWNTSYSSWGTLAYTSDNVASATKLQTARTIWGQIFDGTGNVGGNLYIGQSAIYSQNINDAWSDGTNSHPWYGIDFRYHNTGVYSTTITNYYGLTLKTYSGNISIQNGGNVGIGTTSPSYKLHVNGTFCASGNSSIGGALTVKGGYVGINNSSPEVELDVNGDMFISGYGYINQLAVGFKSHTKQEAINAKDGNIHMFTVSSWSGNLTVNNPIAGEIITVIFKNTNATTGFAVPLGNFAKSENVPVIANGGVSVIQLVCTGSNQGSIYPASVKQYS